MNSRTAACGQMGQRPGHALRVLSVERLAVLACQVLRAGNQREDPIQVVDFKERCMGSATLPRS
jgi:hypothetical protein